jgi:hypothetical protein
VFIFLAFGLFSFGFGFKPLLILFCQSKVNEKESPVKLQLVKRPYWDTTRPNERAKRNGIYT